MDIIEENLNDNSEITANSKQLEILKKNFPNCFDKDGNFIAAKMEEIVAGSGLELSKESYSLNWLGKSYARLLANENPLTMLKEDKEHNNLEENKDSQNILIKGDNLEVLKHLKNAYENQIKMIYIDPPYNTGDDGFVYRDDRKFTIEELSKLAGISLEEAARIIEFTTKDSNSHSAWLTFMYPRLYVAQELLSNDGVIFISIDDNEIGQLKLLCNEIFGEENFVAQLPRREKSSGKSTDGIADNHDYILIYDNTLAKYKQNKHDFKGYNLKDEFFDTRGYYKQNQTLDYDSLSYGKSMDYPIELNGEVFYPGGDKNMWEDRQSGNHDRADWAWRWSEKLFKFGLENGFVSVNEGNDRKRIYTKTYQKVTIDKKALKIVPLDRGKSVSTIEFTNKEYSNDNATKEIKKLFEKSYFDYAKPTILIKKLAELVTDDGDIILDFFAGSGTTADSVMQLGDNKKFITVQLPEEISKKHKSVYDFVKNTLQKEHPTIFEITKERILRASKQIEKEISKDAAKDINNFDLGFKIYETVPLLKNPLNKMDKFDDKQAKLFDPTTLKDNDFNAILTTWKVHDGMKLNDELKEVSFKDYKAYYGDKKLYFINSGFTTEDLKEFIKKLDDDKSFEPNRLILFGYTFDSKYQREISEALNSYKNKKSIEIDMIVRY